MQSFAVSAYTNRNKPVPSFASISNPGPFVIDVCAANQVIIKKLKYGSEFLNTIASPRANNTRHDKSRWLGKGSDLKSSEASQPTPKTLQP